MSSHYAKPQMLYCKNHREPTIHRPMARRTRPDNPFKIHMRCTEEAPGTKKICNRIRVVSLKIPIGDINPDDLKYRWRDRPQWFKIGMATTTGRCRL